MRYIIIDPAEGIFLGTHGSPVPARGVRIIPLFSKENMFEIRKAASWPTHDAAVSYMNRYLKQWCPTAFVVQIDSVDSAQDFVDVIDIVKSGYGKYAEEMVDAIPMENRSVH